MQIECNFHAFSFLAKWNENRNPQMLRGHKTTTVVDNSGESGRWVGVYEWNSGWWTMFGCGLCR